MVKSGPVSYKILIVVAAVIIAAQLYISTQQTDLVTSLLTAKIEALERNLYGRQDEHVAELMKLERKLDEYQNKAARLSSDLPVVANEAVNYAELKKQIDIVRFDLMVARAQVESINVKREGKLPLQAMSWIRGQGGQDVHMYETHFHHLKTPGVFVEFGARDGISDSNTYMYEKGLEWTGVLIEAVYHDFQYLAANRPSSKSFNSAVCDAEKDIEFLVSTISGWHGAVETYDKKRKEQKQEVVKVKCYPLSYYFDQAGYSHVNYMTIDTEGSELSIIKPFDTLKYRVDFIQVEVLRGKEEYALELVEVMRQKQYVLEAILDFASDTDDFVFRRKDVDY